MRTLIRKLVLEYGTRRARQTTRQGGLSDRRRISPGWLKAEPCDVDLDGKAVVMKWRPADLTMLDANTSWHFMLHEALLCVLSNCSSAKMGGNGVVNVWLCLNRLLCSLMIFQKEGNNRAVVQSPHVQDTKAGVYKNEFHCPDCRRQCWYMTASLTVSLREEKILWAMPKWASILPSVGNEYAVGRLCIAHMSFSFIYQHIHPSLNGHWALANCLVLC